MGRFILRFRGKGPLPDEMVEHVEQLPETRIVERTPQMLLVEGPEEALRGAVSGRSDWLFVAERSYTPPDSRPRVKR